MGLLQGQYDAMNLLCLSTLEVDVMGVRFKLLDMWGIAGDGTVF